MLNKHGERELAYLVTIDAIEPITGSDNCECSVVGGWRVMTRKGTFKPGDVAVYFEIDSVVDYTRPEFAFLASRKGKIKTQRYTFGGKGLMISQGLLMSPEDFGWENLGNGEVKINGKIYRAADEDTRFLTSILDVRHIINDTDRVPNVKPIDKYKQMAQRHYKLFRKPAFRWLMRRDWGKKLLFIFLGHTKKKAKDKGWPVGMFPGVSKTDQERCLEGRTKIATDKGDIMISKIVNQKMDVKVLSVNPDGTFSFKKILDYQKFENKEDVLTITYPYNPGSSRTNKIVCTSDHRFLTPNGYIHAKDLKIGDNLLMPDVSYGEADIGAIYGMLLGDSHIQVDKRTSGKLRVVATNGEKQMDYLLYKKRCFMDEGSICNSGKGSYANSDDVYHWTMPVDSYIDKKVREDFYISGKKRITNNVIDKMNVEGLAFWYMDDGNLSNRNEQTQRANIRLNTQGFSYEENLLLVEMLNHKFGISCHATEEKREGKPNYYHIYIDVEGTPAFLELVTPYMCKSMSYKTLPRFEHLIETKTVSHEKNLTAIEIPILNIEVGQTKTKNMPFKPPYVYDIEVEDNHNFIAGNVISHNCENMPHILNDKTPYIKTQKCDGSSGTYILARKKNKFSFIEDSFEFYVCSRNVRMLKPEQECFYGEHNYYWEVAEKYKIEKKMKDYLTNNPDISFVCWQGEICAPAIQKNPHNLKETHFYCFHMTDSKNGRYDIREAAKIWQHYMMEVVPIVDTNYIMPDDFEEFKLSADGVYDSDVCEGHIDCPREGFVYYKTTDPTFSFKNVSRQYLLGRKE